jgi:hypothetical protein
MIQDLNDQKVVHQDHIVEELYGQDLEHITGGVCLECARVVEEAGKDVLKGLSQWMGTHTSQAANKFSDAVKLRDKATSDSLLAGGNSTVRSCPNCEANKKALADLRGGK